MATYKETIQVQAAETASALYQQCLAAAAANGISGNHLRKLLGVSSASAWQWSRGSLAPRSLEVALRMQVFLKDPAQYRRK